MKVLVDAALINFSFLLAYYLRFKVLLFITPGSMPIFEKYFGTLIFITLLWLALFKLLGMYDKKVTSIIDEAALLFSSVSVSSLLLLGMLFLYRSFWFSRLVIVNAWVVSFVLLFLYRLFVYLLQRMLYLKGVGLKRVLIIGAGEIGQTIASKMRNDKTLGGIPVAVIDDVADIAKIKDLIRQQAIDEVIFAESSLPYQKILDIITECETMGVKFKIVPGILEIMASRIDIDEVGGVPLITVSEIGLAGFNAFIKRTADIVISTILLVVLFIPFIIVAVLIKLDSSGTVFIFQERVGKDGKTFQMFKFRSMVKNAEDVFQSLKDRSEVEGHVFKMKNDPRMTRIGRFIRRASIDELPQLFNVFLGQMSLVGPRPPLPREVVNYSPWHKKRLRVSPGITGLWQVSGRSLLPFEDMVRLDIYYIENWSLWSDFKILCRTAPVVLLGSGAF